MAEKTSLFSLYLQIEIRLMEPPYPVVEGNREESTGPAPNCERVEEPLVHAPLRGDGGEHHCFGQGTGVSLPENDGGNARRYADRAAEGWGTEGQEAACPKKRRGLSREGRYKNQGRLLPPARRELGD